MQHIERLSRRANIFGNLGLAKGGVTVNPSADGSSGGVCWGVGYKEAFAQGRDASDVREALAPLMPELGEDRRIVSDIVGHVRSSGQVYSPAQRSVRVYGLVSEASFNAGSSAKMRTASVFAGFAFCGLPQNVPSSG